MRTCLFCDSTELTLEHVWPRWISRLFHPKPVKGQYRIETESTLHAPIRRSAKLLDQTAKVVCEPCNTGWMHELEECAKPILTPLILARGGARDLDALAQATILTWALQRAMVFEHTVRKAADRFYEQDERVQFANSSEFEPPPGVYVWLAQYRGRRAIHSTIQNLSARPKSGSGAHHVQVISVTIRHFAFQVVAGRWPERDRLDLKEIDASTWQRPTIRLWPGREHPIRWPPTEYLSDQTLKAFTDRFNGSIPLRPLRR